MPNAIADRRSIRKYKTDAIPRSMIDKILNAGIAAPSSKNRQPWKFIVVTGESKKEMLEAMEKGLKRERLNPLLPESAKYIKGAEYTLSIMREAPVVIFIMNALGMDMNRTLTAEERIFEICNAQSIGAAVENMTLAATEMGLGSLWICDTYFAYEELRGWLNTQGELFAALTLGYSGENPEARPRKGIDKVAEWRN